MDIRRKTMIEKYAYPGDIRKGNDNTLYFKQSKLYTLNLINGSESLLLDSGKSMFVNKLDEEMKTGDAKFAEYEIVATQKIGDGVKPKYKRVKAFNVVTRKDGAGKYLKVACDRIEAVNNGEKILFEKGDILNLQTKEDMLERSAYLFETGVIDEALYQERVERAEKMPDYVVANIYGKGKVL